MSTLLQASSSVQSSEDQRSPWYAILVVPVVIVAIWWIAAVLANSAVFPTPVQAAQGLWVDLNRAGYRENIWVTVQLVFTGILISVIGGGLVGFIAGQSRFWSRFAMTPLSVMFAIPLVALYPIFILVFGIGEQSQLAFAVAHSIFPMAMTVMVAVGGIDPNLLKLGRALRLSHWDQLRKIVFPSVLPSFVTALRIAYSLTFLGLILAGMVSSNSGLGHELVINIANARLDRIMGQVVLIVIIAVVPGLLLRTLEVRLARR